MNWRSFLNAMMASPIGLFSALLIIGCASFQKVDLVARGEVRAERTDSTLIDLSVPQVYRDGDALVVSGTATRKPGVNEPIPGHIQILFLSKEGVVLDELRPLWRPRQIPTTGSRRASYTMQYAWIPPQGTIVRAVYGEHHHEGPPSGGDTGVGAVGAGIAGSVYTRTPPTPSMPRQMGTPGTPFGGRR